MINRKNAGWMNNAMLLCLLSLAMVLGCGGSSDMGRVKGVVTLDGQPVADATVEFTPEGEGRPSTGMTDANGHYELAYSAKVNGAEIGRHNVKITTGGMKPDELAVFEGSEGARRPESS